MTASRGPWDVVGSFGVAMENDSSRVQGYLLVQLGANPTNKLGLIRAGK